MLWPMTKRLLWVALVAALTSCAPGQPQNEVNDAPATREVTARPPVGSRIQQQEVFDDLWTTIDRNYVYDDFNGVDWHAARETYQRRIDAGLTDEAFWAAMQEMVSLLQDQHTEYLSPSQTEERNLLHGGELGFVGIGLFFHPLPEKGYAVVLIPFAGGPAEQAGIAAHDRLLAVEGVPFCCDDQGLARVDRVLGPPGTDVTLMVQTPGEERRDLTITRAAVQVDFPVLSRRLAGDIGYILVPSFQTADVAEKTEDAWRELTSSGPLNGLILDLRASRGGLGTELSGILALFVEGEMGRFTSRKETRPLRIRGQDVAGSRSVPLVVLVGEITESFAEVMAGVLQEAGRAALVGMRTAGNIEATHRHDFADGSSAWIAQEVFIPPSGTNWEGRGVAPDIEIDQDWDEFATEEGDLALGQALTLLDQ